MLSKFEGIPKEVDKNLPQAAGVSTHGGRHLSRDQASELEPLVMGALGEQFDHLCHSLAHLKVEALQLQLARFDLREIEEVVDYLQQRVGGGLDHAQVLALLFGQLAGVIVLGPALALGIGLILALTAAFALWIATQLFQREAILTRWR